MGLSPVISLCHSWFFLVLSLTTANSSSSTVLSSHTSIPITSTASPPTTGNTSSLQDVDDDKDKLYIIGLFALSKAKPYPAGEAFQIAAQVAVEDINNRTDVLPDFHLELDVVDTQCDRWVGTDHLYRKLYNGSKNHTSIMVLGGTCSHVTEVTASTSYRWNLTQISYSALSPTLSDKKLYPWFFRIMASENVLSNHRIELMKHFEWTHLSMLQESYTLFSATVESLREDLQENNITLNSIEPFNNDPQTAIQKLKENDARIIYFASYEDKARNACCTAYRKGLYGEKIVWIFPGFFHSRWYDKNDTDCNQTEILQVIEGYFTVQNINLDDNVSETISLNADEYRERYRAKYESSRHHIPPVGSDRAPLAYDSMWAIALALNTTEQELRQNGTSLKNFTNTDRWMGEMIKDNMKNVSFVGLSGEVSFNVTNDRKHYKIAIRQFQKNATNHYNLVTIGVYDSASGSKEPLWNDSAVQWRDGASIPPLSAKKTQRELMPLSWQLYCVWCSLAGLGILVALGFLAFNIKYRNVRLIKMSSPRINNLILIGCIMGYVTIIMEDINGTESHFLCHGRVYLLVLGFSLCYGALFAKTWRVYEIMTAIRRLSTKALRDSRLFLTVAVLVGINLLVLLVWTAVDPMTVVREDLDESETSRGGDMTTVYQAQLCHSEYMVHFSVGLLALQALLVAFGAFLAWQTRNMTIPELNDSRWVGLCIYSVVVLGLLGAIHVLVGRPTPDTSYILSSALVFAGTTLTQCLVFVPKLIAYRRSKNPKHSERSVLTFRTVCVGGSSTSLGSSFNSLPSAASCSTLPQHQEESAEPKASSLSAAFMCCCSREAGTTDVHPALDEVENSAIGTEPARISRAVSACNICSIDELGNPVFVTAGSKASLSPPACGARGLWALGRQLDVGLLANHDLAVSAVRSGGLACSEGLHWCIGHRNCCLNDISGNAEDSGRTRVVQPLTWLESGGKGYTKKSLQLRRSLSDEHFDSGCHRPASCRHAFPLSGSSVVDRHISEAGNTALQQGDAASCWGASDETGLSVALRPHISRADARSSINGVTNTSVTFLPGINSGMTYLDLLPQPSAGRISQPGATTPTMDDNFHEEDNENGLKAEITHSLGPENLRSPECDPANSIMTTGLIRASASVKWQTPGEESTQCQCTAETIHRSVSAILLHPHHDFADVATAEASRLSLDGPSLCNGPLPLANAPVLSVGTSPPCDSIPIPPVTLPEQACFYLPHDEDVSSR